MWASRLRLLVVKAPYYVRSAIALVRALRPRTRLRWLLGSRSLSFRQGFELEVPELLDLLIAKETICDDAYRLDDLGGEAPRLIVDVGAGIGDFTVFAASRFPDAEVLALEPNPNSFAVLEHNVHRNRLANVRLRCIAVGTRSSYELSRGSWARTATAFADRGDVAVRAVPLSTLIGDLEVDLLKIDCEGAELDVLASLGEAARLVQRVALEYHDHLVKDSSLHAEDFLAAEGFTVRRDPDRYDGRIGYLYAWRS